MARVSTDRLADTGGTLFHGYLDLRLRSGAPAKLPEARLIYEGAGALQWVEMAFEGEWRGHPSGDFEFTADDLKDIKRNFDRLQNEIPVYYEHPEGDEDRIFPTRQPAAGWIHEMRLAKRPDGLMAIEGLVEMSPQLALDVAAKAYRYSSVVVRFGAIDRVTGDEIGTYLRNLGFVNEPFLDGQRPITLSAKTTRRSMGATNQTGERELGTVGEAFEGTLEALGIEERAEFTPDVVRKIAADLDLQAQRMANRGPAGEGEEAEGAELGLEEQPGDLEAEGAGDDPAAMMAQLMEAAGVASFEELLAMLQTMGSGGDGGEPQLSAAGKRLHERQLAAAEAKVRNAEKKNRELSGKVDGLAKQVRELTADKRIAEALAAGHIRDVDVDDLRKAASDGDGSFERFLSHAEKHPLGPPTGTVTSGGDGAGAGEAGGTGRVGEAGGEPTGGAEEPTDDEIALGVQRARQLRPGRTKELDRELGIRLARKRKRLNDAAARRAG